MRKSLIVAQSEFATLVRSKAFLIGIILLPVFMGGSFLLARVTSDATDDRERRFAIVDHSGVLGRAIAEAVKALNASDTSDERASLVPVEVPIAGRSGEDLRIELSEKVRREELFAFVEIPAGILDPQAREQVRYYSNHPSYSLLPRRIRQAASRVVEYVRFQKAGVDPQLVAKLTVPVRVEELGLVERDDNGQVQSAQQVDNVQAQGVPFAFLMLMFITLMSSAPQLLNSVIEEKMSRIAEVLIGSVSPFELMVGKLAGGAAVCALLAFIYVGGALGMAYYWGFSDAVAGWQLAWFAFYLLMAVLLFGSVFIAVGAACTDLKDS